MLFGEVKVDNFIFSNVYLELRVPKNSHQVNTKMQTLALGEIFPILYIKNSYT